MIRSLHPTSTSIVTHLTHPSLSFTFSLTSQLIILQIGDQAECIYQVSWEIMKHVDMRWRNVKYYHLYDEGSDLDFDMALYFFELLVKFHEDPKNSKWKDGGFARSIPKDMTAIVRKKEIRDTVDVNFDGRVSFLEYLLYQYNLSPKDLMQRSIVKEDAPVNEALVKARAALDDVNRKIREYEAEKSRLEEASQGTGVKALTAKNMLAQLNASPLAEQLRKLLITAEAAVRLAAKGMSSSSTSSSTTTVSKVRTDGELWWLNRDIKAKKEKYGPAAK